MFRKLSKNLKLECDIFKRLVLFTFIAIVSVLAVSYISYLLGSEYFFIELKEEVVHTTIGVLIQTFVLSISMYCSLLFATKLEYKQMLAATIAFYVMAMLLYFTNGVSAELVSLLCFMIGIISILFMCDKTVITILKLLLFNAIVALYSVISIPIKANIFNMNIHENMNIRDGLKYSIDNTIFMICISVLFRVYGDTIFIKVKRRIKYAVEYLGRSVSGRSNQSSRKSSKVSKYLKQESGDGQKLKEYLNSKSKKDKVIYSILIVMLWLVQMLLVFSVCRLDNVLLELCVIIPCFWFYRIIMKKSYHCDSFSMCTLVTVFAFYMACKITIPLQYSMFFSILVGFFVAFIFHKIKVYQDSKECSDGLFLGSINSEHKRTKNKLKQIGSKSIFYSILDDVILSDVEKQVLELHYIEKKNFDIIADIIGFSYDWTVRIHNKSLLKVGEII